MEASSAGGATFETSEVSDEANVVVVDDDDEDEEAEEEEEGDDDGDDGDEEEMEEEVVNVGKVERGGDTVDVVPLRSTVVDSADVLVLGTLDSDADADAGADAGADRVADIDASCSLAPLPNLVVTVATKFVTVTVTTGEGLFRTAVITASSASASFGTAMVSSGRLRNVATGAGIVSSASIGIETKI